MKSKISFFNKAIFKKNLTLYWPIWTVYTIILLCMHPIMFWLELYYSKFYSVYTKEQKLMDLINCLYTEPGTLLIAMTSIIVGMALYGYLYNHKSANMIHALPVDRNQLFGTNVISGLAFLIVPLFVTAVFMSAVAVGYGVPEIGAIWIWFLLMAGIAFSSFSIVTFCAMFTGHMVALPVYVIILNFLSMWAYFQVYTVITAFGYGIENIGLGIYHILEYFSPFHCFMGNVWIGEKWDEFSNFQGMEVYGVEIVVVYTLVSIALLAFAYFTYKKRHVEQAGDFITVEWLKPIFRWGAGMTGGVFGSLFIREILNAVRIGCNMFTFIIIMLILGGICYFAADMLIRKTFHVFKKKNWIGCGIFSVILLVSFFGLFGVANYIEDYVPEKDEIKYASINMGYDISMKGEAIEQILAIHEEFLEHKGYCEEFLQSGNWEYEWVSISYVMENGDYFSRGYIIPYEYEGLKDVADTIVEMENDPENLLVSMLCRNYEEVDAFGYCYLRGYFASDDVGEYEEYEEYEGFSYSDIDLTEEQTKKLYEAVIADAKAGKLNAYNKYVTPFEEDVDMMYTEAGVEFEFRNPNTDFDTYDEYVQYYDGLDMWDEYTEEYWMYTYISFGPDCENIINTLIELEIIESADDIYWGDSKY